MKSRSRLEIREWSYDNLDLVSPGESKKNNSQSRLEKFISSQKIALSLESESEILNPTQQGCREGKHMI